MIISVCIPCKNRVNTLAKTMRSYIKAANLSPPVEFMIVDYNSKDDLVEYIKYVWKKKLLKPPNKLSYAKYMGRKYYHLAHAYNLAVKASIGEYIIVSGTEFICPKYFFQRVRQGINNGHVWMRIRATNSGMLILRRKEFMECGGYDERFELYGGEDKDIIFRLKRRGIRKKVLYKRQIPKIRTIDKRKIKYYNSKMTKNEMMAHNAAIREENIKNKVLVANEGKPWGQWG